jgi:hypothetical protein
MSEETLYVLNNLQHFLGGLFIKASNKITTHISRESLTPAKSWPSYTTYIHVHLCNGQRHFRNR